MLDTEIGGVATLWLAAAFLAGILLTLGISPRLVDRRRDVAMLRGKLEQALREATPDRLREQVETERQILAKLSASVPLSEVLEELVRTVEAESDPGVLASILYLDRDGQRLLHGAAPNLPAAYNEKIDGIEIGPNVGSCGRAAFLGQPVFVADIATAPSWSDYRELALTHGLRACSSLPIKATDGRILGTFAIYYREMRLPSHKDVQALELVAHIAALAIERNASEQVVRDTRQRLQLALDSAQLGVWSVDLRTGAFENDARDRKHHGHSESCPPRTVDQARCCVHTDDLPRLDAAFAAAGKRGQCTTEYRIRRQLGNEPVWLAVEGNVLRDTAGIPMYLIGVTRDITNQKRVENSLRTQRGALENLLGALPAAIYVTDVAGRITYCNQSAVDLWGRHPKLYVDHWFAMAKFFYPDGRPMPRADCPSTLTLEGREAVCGHEAILERSDGTRVPIMPSPTPLFGDTGNMIGIVNMMVDLTEQKRAEAALLERSAQLRIAEKAALVGSFSHEVSSSVAQLSPGCAAILELPDGTTEAPMSTWRSRIHSDDLRLLDAAQALAFSERRAEHSTEYRMLLPGGATRWIEARNATSYGDDGRPLRTVGVNIDITERKLAERQKNTLIAELDHRVKNALACVAAIAHHTRDCITSLEEFFEVFDGRINTMANSQTLLSRNRWQGVDLMELVTSELSPCSGNDNTIVSGLKVVLATDAVQPLAMVLHELVTNAAKYGALSNQYGKVIVSWCWQGHSRETPELVIRWKELGGPPVAPPTRKSYGTSVIRDLIPYELGGSVEWEFTRSGLYCSLGIPGKWIDGGTARRPVVLPAKKLLASGGSLSALN